MARKHDTGITKRCKCSKDQRDRDQWDHYTHPWWLRVKVHGKRRHAVQARKKLQVAR